MEDKAKRTSYLLELKIKVLDKKATQWSWNDLVRALVSSYAIFDFKEPVIVNRSTLIGWKRDEVLLRRKYGLKIAAKLVSHVLSIVLILSTLI